MHTYVPPAENDPARLFLAVPTLHMHFISGPLPISQGRGEEKQPSVEPS
jgi:hypothetical protein